MTATRSRGPKKAKDLDVKTTPTAAPMMVAGQQVKLQRNPLRITLAILAIALSALGAAWLATSYRNTTDVVTVRQNVSRGEVIQRDDLQSASITLDPALRTIPKSEIDSLVGKRAASDLQAGTTVTRDQIAGQAFPPKGGSVVGVYLSVGQLPQTPLRAGSTVRLVATPKAGDDPQASGEALAFTATVVTTQQLSDSTHITVDLLVPTDQANKVASLAATQRMAIILDGE